MSDQRKRSPAEAECSFDRASRTWSCAGASVARPPETPELRLELLRITSEHFRQDISSFWGHATFYVVLQGALGTVFATVVGPQGEKGTDNGLVPREVLALILALIALLFAVAWLLTSIGRRTLIGAWRNEVLHQEALLLARHRSYARVEELAERLLLEPTRITVWMPAVLSLAWLGAAVWSGMQLA